MVCEVGDGCVEDVVVGEDDVFGVGGLQLGCEQVDLLDRVCDASDVHYLVDFEGAEDEEYDVRGEVAERVLEGEFDREIGGGDHGREARGLDVEYVEVV